MQDKRQTFDWTALTTMAVCLGLALMIAWGLGWL